MSTRLFAAFLVVSGVAGCEKANLPFGAEQSWPVDKGVRGLLRASSLSGAFEAPKNKPYYGLSVFEFENGVFRKSLGLTSHTVDSLDGGQGFVELIWDGGSDNRGEKVKMAKVTPGTSSYFESEFWSSMDFRANFEASQRPTFEGLEIIGMAASALDYSGKELDRFSADFEATLKEHKHVGILVVGYFDSKAEMENQMLFRR